MDDNPWSGRRSWHLLRHMSKKIWTQDLGLRWVSAKFVRWVLTPEQKEHHLTVSKEITDCAANDENFLPSIITSETTRVSGYDPEIKCRSSQWKTPSTPRPNKDGCAQMWRRCRLCSFDSEGVCAPWVHSTMADSESVVLFGRSETPKRHGSMKPASKMGVRFVDVTSRWCSGTFSTLHTRIFSQAQHSTGSPLTVLTRFGKKITFSIPPTETLPKRKEISGCANHHPICEPGIECHDKRRVPEMHQKRAGPLGSPCSISRRMLEADRLDSLCCPLVL